jgi:hypothetical protein
MFNLNFNLTRIKPAQSGELNPKPRVALSFTQPREANHPQPRAGEDAMTSPERRAGHQPRKATNQPLAQSGKPARRKGRNRSPSKLGYATIPRMPTSQFYPTPPPPIAATLLSKKKKKKGQPILMITPPPPHPSPPPKFCHSLSICQLHIGLLGTGSNFALCRSETRNANPYPVCRNSLSQKLKIRQCQDQANGLIGVKPPRESYRRSGGVEQTRARRQDLVHLLNCRENAL